MEQMQGMKQNGEARLGYGEGLDEQLAEWSAELFRDPQYRNKWADAEHTWRLESAARTRLIIKKQLREEIEQEMAKELGLPANWRGNKLRSLADWHEKMACLAKADAAPRCEHVFQDGTRCGSPQMKSGELCYAHERMARVRPRKLNLLAMEDANAIMLNIMEINRALVDEEITEKRAGMLLYSQQLGLQALGKLTFPKSGDRVIARDLVIGNPTPLKRGGTEGAEELTAKDAKSAKQEEVSRERTRMNTNEKKKLATDPRQAGTGEHGRALIGEELPEAGEGGMNALSPVDDGMEGTGQDHRVIWSSGDRVIGKAEEFTLTPAHEARAGDPGAKDAKVAKHEEQDRTAEVAESAEKEEFDTASTDELGGGALPPAPSHDLKELAGEIPDVRKAAHDGQVWTRSA